MNGTKLANRVMKVVMPNLQQQPPCDEATLRRHETRLGIVLPPDLRAFYSHMDGTDLTDFEHGLVSFWPLDRWNPISEEAPEFETPALAGTVVFACHSYWVHAFAARFVGDSRMETFTVAVGNDRPIAQTFSEFVDLVLSNDTSLWGGS